MAMLNLYTTSLRDKILLGFTVILLIMFLATLWSIFNFYRFNETIKKTMQDNYSVIIAVDNMGKTLDEQVQSVIVMFNQDFQKGDSLFTKSEVDFFYWHQRTRDLVTSAEEKKILDIMQVDLNHFKEKNINTLDYKIFIRGQAPKVKVDLGNIITELQIIKERCNRILEINHVFLNKAVEDVRTITQTAAITILVILLGAIAISFAFATKFSEYIVRPITKLRQSVSHVAEGNFEERIDLDENSDEINSLADEFNKMSERLQGYEQLNLNKILFEKKKSELVIEGMNEPVLMIDDDFSVLLSNKAFDEIFGETAVKNEEIKKILIKEKAIAEKSTLVDIQSHREDVIKIKDHLGAQKYYNVIAALLNIPESGTTGTVFVFNDVTKYQELDRMKSEFIAKVSHELKTPLTSLGMALGLFEDGIVGKISKKQLDLIISMKEDYERLNKLVYEILELTKLEANLGKTKFEKLEVHRLADYVSKKFTILAKETRITLEVNDSTEGAMINGNIDTMISAVENLVANSLKFTPRDGEIKIDFTKDNGNIFIEISDTGIGISPDNLKKVFDKFIQIDDSAPGSLGLGLSIAKEIIELHDGEIKAFSELGKGSTFQIKLPVA
jgi:signal transduction histidine kinase